MSFESKNDFIISNTGVRVFKDWKRNILIPRQRDVPRLNVLIAHASSEVYSKGLVKGLSRLGSENSEDAVTWSVVENMVSIMGIESFASKILNLAGCNAPPEQELDGMLLKYWSKLTPPKTISWAERDSVPDIMLENKKHVIIIEAKLTSDISPRTTHCPKRNQLARLLHCGINHLNERTLWLVLLAFGLKENGTCKGVETVKAYRNGKEIPEYLVDHTTILQNNIGFVTGEQLISFIKQAIPDSGELQRYMESHKVGTLDSIKTERYDRRSLA